MFGQERVWGAWRQVFTLVPLVLSCVAIAFLMGGGGDLSSVQSLTGVWPAEVSTSKATTSRTLPYPLRFEREGLQDTSKVTWNIPLRLERAVSEQAILVERPLFTAEVSWDGKSLGQVGEMGGAGAWGAGWHPLLVRIPADLTEKGEHLLSVTVQGGLGMGGAQGGLWYGEFNTLEREYHRLNHRWTFTAVVILACSIIGLWLALVRPHVKEFFWNSVFLSSLGVYPLVVSIAGWAVFQEVSVRLRLLVVAAAVSLAAILKLCSYMAQRPHDRITRWGSLFFFLLALVLLVWPGEEFLGAVKRLLEFLSVGVLVWGGYLLLQGKRAGVEQIGFFLIGGACLCLGYGWEIAWQKAYVESSPFMAPGTLAYIGFSGVSVVTRFADMSSRYEQLIRKARDSIMAVDSSGRIRACNAAAQRLLGSGLLGSRLLDRIPAEARSLVESHIQGEVGMARVEITLPVSEDTEVLVESLAEKLPHGMVLMVLRDISERREVEEKFLQSARLEVVSGLAGAIAHDLNNTLTALMGHLSLLRERVADGTEETTSRFEHMEAIVLAAAQLSNRLMMASRGVSEQPVRLDFCQVVRDTVELVSIMMPQNVQLESDCDSDLPTLVGHRKELEQLVINLILNARDALIFEGGTIEVKVNAAADGSGGAVLVVQDDGPGIPEELAGRVWEPFFSTKPEGSGTGLGLAVVSRVARAHRARIRTGTGSGGKGTRFEIEFPNDSSTLASQHRSGAGGCSAWIVEDDPSVRELLVHLVGQQKTRVTAFSSAEELLESLDAGKAPAADVLIADVVLSGCTGLDLARTLSRRQPTLAVVIVSGWIPSDSVALDPAWVSVAKPFAPAVLQDAVTQALAQVAGQESCTS